MKKIVLLIVFIMRICFLFSQTSDDFNLQYNELVENHKYLSAYNLINENKDILSNNDYAIKTTDLLLNYFVMSTMHQMFALIDIPSNEEIYSYRGKEGRYEYIMFDPVLVLNEAIKNDKKNGELYFYLGQYYYEVLSKYDGQWLLSNDEIRNMSIENYSKSYEFGFRSTDLVGNLGQLFLQKNDFENAIQYLNEAIELSPNNPAYFHNLAVCYLNIGDIDIGIENVRKAIEYYDNDYWKADSCFLLGTLFLEKNDFKEAINSFENGKALAPNEYKYIDRLIELYLYTNELEKAKENAIDFFHMYPTNPTVTSMILNHYFNYGKIEEIDYLLIDLVEMYRNQDEPLGNLYFTWSIATDANNNYQKSLDYIETSRNYFKRVFDNNHQVFNELNNLEKQVKEKI